MSLELLIKEAAKGCAKAQAGLFDHLSGQMAVICRRFMKDQRDAEERMLDGFYDFFRSLKTTFRYRSDAKTLAFLKKTMVQKCLIHLRKNCLYNIVFESEIEDVPFTDNGIENFSPLEINLLIDSLPEGYKTVLNLYVSGFDHKEIAKMLDINEVTSRSQLWKAKTSLQKLLIAKGYKHEKVRSTE